MITKFIAFESVRSHMTGKSIDDVKKTIDALPIDNRLAHIYKYHLKDYYTPKELNDMFSPIATKISNILMKDYDYYYEDNAYQWALSHMDEILELITKGWALSDVVYSIMMGRDKEDEQTNWEEDEQQD